MSLTRQTGDSEAMHSPEAWVSIVVNGSEWVSWSIAVVQHCDFALAQGLHDVQPTGEDA